MRNDGSGRPPLDKEREVRMPIALALTAPGVTLSIVKVYVALRDYAGFEATSNNFMLAWPSIDTIAVKAGISRDSVIEAVKWLDLHHFVVKERGKRGSNLYRVIIHRELFRATEARHGRSAAIDQFEAWRREMAAKSRKGQAKAAATRRARQEGARDWKSDVRHLEGHAQLRRSDPGDLGGGAGPTLGWEGTDLAGGVGPTRSVDQGSGNQGTAIQENRGVADAPLIVPLEANSEEPRTAVRRVALPEELRGMVTQMRMALRPVTPPLSESERELKRHKVRADAEKVAEEYGAEKRRGSSVAET